MEVGGGGGAVGEADVGTRACTVCGEAKGREAFSRKQWGDGKRCKCEGCVRRPGEGGADAADRQGGSVGGPDAEAVRRAQGHHVRAAGALLAAAQATAEEAAGVGKLKPMVMGKARRGRGGGYRPGGMGRGGGNPA